MFLTRTLLIAQVLSRVVFADQIENSEGGRGHNHDEDASLRSRHDWKDVDSVTSVTPLNVVLHDRQTVNGLVATPAGPVSVGAATAAQSAPLQHVLAFRYEAEQRACTRLLKLRLIDLLTMEAFKALDHIARYRWIA